MDWNVYSSPPKTLFPDPYLSPYPTSHRSLRQDKTIDDSDYLGWEMLEDISVHLHFHSLFLLLYSNVMWSVYSRKEMKHNHLHPNRAVASSFGHSVWPQLRQQISVLKWLQSMLKLKLAACILEWNCKYSMDVF